MKFIRIFAVLFCLILASASFANCDLKVATAAGQYLAALEQANLRRYQNNSVCEVLHYEFWNCTEKQKAKLKSSFDLNNVLGNYCQPHLPPPQIISDKNQFLKGAELFSWRDLDGYLWYALLTGTNRPKTSKELTESKVSPGYLKQEFKNLPSKTQIVWNNLVALENKPLLEFSLPDEKSLKEILKSAESANLKITISK